MKRKNKKNKKTKKLISAITLLIIGTGIYLFGNNSNSPKVNINDHYSLANQKFDGKNQVITVNNNHVNFTADDLSLKRGSWEKYSNLDSLNRVGEANAMLSRKLMPHSERGNISSIHPTGWKNKKIMINGKPGFLYNRCHLIAWQLTGQNANIKNLMTGTRDLNANFQDQHSSMVFYENQVAQYLRHSKNHLRYRVTPIFKNSELVARGVQMQAKSIEDDQVEFNVYIFNVQKGYTINYQTGQSTKESS